MGAFSYDGMLVRFLNLVADLVALHVLWLLCSLPIVTIGASTTALYYACMKRIRTDEDHVHTNFLRAFRSNFKQATVIWLMLAGAALLLLLDFRIGMALEGPVGTFVLISCAIPLIPFLLTSLCIFPVLAKFENPIVLNLKNALIMSLHNFPFTLLLVVIVLTFALAAVSFIPFTGLCILCGAGIYGYFTSGIFIQVFRRYLPNELEEDFEKTDLYHH